jgi:hypothetical protein
LPLLNYTTEVPVGRSIGQVQGLLVEAGATAIYTEYDQGRITGLSFAVQMPHGRQGFTLPVQVERVQVVLTREKVERRFRTPEHAERVAWRILKDWLEAQLAIIKTEMVTLDQVMLPYMRAADGRTMYELYVDHRLELPAMAVEP